MPNGSGWEFELHMNRVYPYVFVALLSCCAGVAQSTNPEGTAPPPATSTATSTETSEVAQFQKIEDSWSDAVNRHDQYGLELVLSPLFVDVASNGTVTTRNQQVAQAITDEDKTLYFSQKVVTVRMLGDIAIANGTYELHHKVGSASVDEKGVFTHVFEHVRGGWLCINSQRTLLHQDQSGKQQKRQSTAEEPFHIPFFSKSDKGPQ